MSKHIDEMTMDQEKEAYLLALPGVQDALSELETSAYVRRCALMHELYIGTPDRPGMSLLDISFLTKKADSTASRCIRAHQRTIGGVVAKDEDFLRQVTAHTLNMFEGVEDTNELIEKELQTAVVNKPRGYANWANGLIQNLRGNRELQAKLLRLLDPKIEITVRTERALKQQEAILRALSEVDPELAEKVLARAEAFMAESEQEGVGSNV